MDTKELIKKYWFIGVVAVALIAFIGVYAADSYKNREIVVDTRQVDGKYVVYTVDGEDVYADDFYDTLFDSYGTSISFLSYERAVLAASYETTDEMSASAANYAANVLSYYSASDIAKSLKSAGYANGVDDLQEYYISLQKRDMAVKEYVKANADKYLTDSFELGTNGRLIYHILVKCDVEAVTDEEGNLIEYKANPTEEQTQKLNTILDALKDENSTFEYTAYQYSDDSETAQYGGYFRIVNEENKGILDPFFAKTAMELSDGEVSDPIVSQYGYHIIRSVGSTIDSILDDYYFLSKLETNYPNLIIEAIMSKADEAGFEIVDEEVKAQIDAQLGSEAE